MKKLSAKKKVKLIKKWSSWFYDHTNSFEEGTIGSELAYLYAAICKNSDYVVVAKDSDLFQLLECEGIKKTDRIWDYIKVEE